jgi:hypothetical protein
MRQSSVLLSAVGFTFGAHSVPSCHPEGLPGGPGGRDALPVDA